MTISKIQELLSLGQSLWYDNIQRHLLEDGELENLVAVGDIRGVTSNPTIFNNAISKSRDYDSSIIPLSWSGWNAEQIFWELAIEDVRRACDIFLELYQRSQGADGFISIEVTPNLAHDTKSTIEQVKHLWKEVNRPNLMVKIPATLEGLPAIQECIADGININITLIFSIERYKAVMQSFLKGIDDRLARHLPVDKIASVASFFVSRMDVKVDPLLPENSALRGKTAIAYTKLAYQEFEQVFKSDKFKKYLSAGCHPQRPLWASTGTKNPAYSDTLYVDNLIGPDTVNTVPPHTLDAFRDHGKPQPTIQKDLDQAKKTILDVEKLGISMERVTQELEQEGVKTFSDAYTVLLESIDNRRSSAISDLGKMHPNVSRRIAQLISEDFISRIWRHDPSLWVSDTDGKEEIQKRLGWLELPQSSQNIVKEIKDFSSSIEKDGYTHILLLGMGGSSLAPEVLDLLNSRFDTSGKNKKGTFSILDSTDPEQILEVGHKFPTDKTLFIVSSKSGGTAEVNALFNYFWEKSGKKAEQFIAITDPGTSLDALANAKGFRKTFHADATVGGRFSALSHFGLVPAALVGIDPEILLGRSRWMMSLCSDSANGAGNPGLTLGAVLGQAYVEGRDKLTIFADEKLSPVGAWLEQLIDESSGKQGKGILVVDQEPGIDPEKYGNDRIFVYLKNDGKRMDFVEKLRQRGHPVLVMDIQGIGDLAAEFYKWEMAISVACAIMHVNAFDQPNVQDSKTRTSEKIQAYNQTGKLDEGKPLFEDNGMKGYSNLPIKLGGIDSIYNKFLQISTKGNYIAINAFISRNEVNFNTLQHLRTNINQKTQCVTTIGFGPRFLHSTGQLHKGGPDTGLFLMLTVDPNQDIPIPGQNASFGTLERAQALGDYEALVSKDRKVLRINFPSKEYFKSFVENLS